VHQRIRPRTQRPHPVRLRLLCLAAIGICGAFLRADCSNPAEAGAHANEPDVVSLQAPQQIERRPFVFQRRPSGRGPSSESREYLPRWLAAVEQHEPGEADAAARTVATWTAYQLSDAVTSFEAGVGPRDKLERLRLLPRAVLLHTDVATMEAADTPDVVSRWPALHWGAAFELVEYLRGLQPTDPFVRTWYRVTAAHLVSTYELLSSPILMDRAVSLFRNDAAFLVMAGGVHELLASPRVQEGDDLQGVDKWGSADRNLNAAARFYREAQNADRSLAEARLRLGRVLGLLGSHAQALSELKAAAGQPLPPAPQYFARIFIGQEEEALGHLDAARNAYDLAIGMRPGFQPAYLALSHLERQAGNRSAAVEAMQKMLVLPQGEHDRDSWAEYYLAGDGQRAGQLLEEFRESFRRPR